MDTESNNAVLLLETLQGTMSCLAKLANHFNEKGAHARVSSLSLSGSPFKVTSEDVTRIYRGSVSLGILVDGPVVKGIDLIVEVLWDDSRWTIMTEAWADDPARDGGRLLRELPERVTDEFSAFLSDLLQACESLSGFEDLVFATSAPN